MFFLGISAHLFIYLLVPAFLAVCFHCRGIQGSPEIASPFPATVRYEYRAASPATGTYVYRTATPQKPRRAFVWHAAEGTPPRIQETLYREPVCPNRATRSDILRAPPFPAFRAEN